MPEWLIIGLVIWFVFNVRGRRRRWRRMVQSQNGDDWLYVGGPWGGGRWGGGWRRGSLPGERMERELPTAARSGRVAAPRPPETAEERLRREFVEGKLTMEEYESRLWQELRPRGGA